MLKAQIFIPFEDIKNN